MSMTIKRKPEEDKIRDKLIEECVRRAKARKLKASSPTKASSDKKDKLKASKPEKEAQVEKKGGKNLEKKVQVELVARKKRKLVDLGASSTVKQIIDTFGKRVIGDGCIISYEGVKLDETLRLEELSGSAPYRLMLDKEE